MKIFYLDFFINEIFSVENFQTMVSDIVQYLMIVNKYTAGLYFSPFKSFM